jgi:2-dehydro-3-deoxygluconokinase
VGRSTRAATDTLHAAPRYTITQIVDRLGAGDAFTAGLVFSFLQNSSPSDTIAFATAAGCLAHSIEGDYNYSTRAEIEAVIQGDSGGRVSR